MPNIFDTNATFPGGQVIYELTFTEKSTGKTVKEKIVWPNSIVLPGRQNNVEYMLDTFQDYISVFTPPGKFADFDWDIEQVQ